MMPPIVRAFIIAMIRFPGSALRFACGLGAAVSLGFLLMWEMGPRHWPFFLGFWAAAIFGHLMQALANHVLGEDRHNVAANQIGQRLAWDLSIDSILIGIAGAGIALGPSLFEGRWRPTAVALILFVGFFYLLFKTQRKREDFLDRWLQDHAEDPHRSP